MDYSLFPRPDTGGVCCKLTVEGLIQVCNDVVDIFCTDGQSDGIRFDSLIVQLFRSQLGVSCTCRVDYQRFHVCYVSQQREDLQSVDKVFRILFTALDVECEDGTSTVREVLVIQILVAIFRQRRMVDLFYLRCSSGIRLLSSCFPRVFLLSKTVFPIPAAGGTH